MAIKHISKINSSFSSSSMTDLVFLLLIFMLLATTLINPNALKLSLPKATNQLKEKPYTTVSITADGRFFIETEEVPFSQLEAALQVKVGQLENPTIALHADKRVAWDEVVKVLKIANQNKYKVIAATQPD